MVVRGSRRWLHRTLLLLCVMPSGCKSWLFYPNQTPGVSLMRRLGSVEATTNWTLRHTEELSVWHGVLALEVFADPDYIGHTPADAEAAVPEVLAALSMIARKLDSGWQLENENCYPDVVPKSVFIIACQAASAASDPLAAYGSIEPEPEGSRLHGAWLEVGRSAELIN